MGSNCLQLSSPVTLSRNGWVATVFTGHSFEEWVGSALHRSLFRGIGVCGLQALWSLGVFRRVVRPCRPLLACPEIPADLPATPPSPTAPPGDTPPRAALAPLQAGYYRGRPPAPPCPGSPTASAVPTAGPCKFARAAGTLPLPSLPPGGAPLRAAPAPPQTSQRRRRPAAPPRPRNPLPSPLAPPLSVAHETTEMEARKAPGRGIAPGADRTHLLVDAFPPMCSGARAVSVRWRPPSSPPYLVAMSVRLVKKMSLQARMGSFLKREFLVTIFAIWSRN